jgi:hypothetical protein
MGRLYAGANNQGSPGTGSVMSDKESPSARYRRLAKECLDVAYTFPDGVRRTVLLQMAQVWQRLADERADSTGLQPKRPEMQQQQQTQPDDDKKE